MQKHNGKQKVIIGSHFRDCDKVQRTHRTDPNSHIPFAVAAPLFTKGEAIVAGVVCVLFVSVVLWKVFG